MEQEKKGMEGAEKSDGNTSQDNNINPYMIPAAIIIAGMIIAGAVIYSGQGQVRAPAVGGSDASSNVKPVSAKTDHIRGSAKAKVKIIEFSDTECPFCKRFHQTMQEAMKEYGEKGDIAWIYRHLPLDQIHSKARIEAAATELANELGGNDKFWTYIDRLYEITPSNDGLDLNLLPQIAEEIGLPRKPFEELVATNDRRGGKFAEHIQSNLDDAIASGGNGTPYSVIIAPNGKTFAFSGAQPYPALKAMIDIALSEK